MNLTPEQRQTLQRGEAVPLTLDGTECVVIRRDTYERVRRVIEYDDRTWNEEEKRALLKAFGERAGWDDPELDVYEEYRQS
ncbi:MAG: hypothetical protein ACREJB_01985 [Planctomycetaceae bacterium]